MPFNHVTNRALAVGLLLLALAFPSFAQEPTVILISLDGFRNDYIDKAPAPNLHLLAKEGVRVSAMKPVFPSKTFPNHYSLVTGLLPVNHGIVSNTIFDPTTNSWFRISDSNAVRDSRWWWGEPIWVTAVKQGKKSACYFWVGSEAEVGSVRPTYWMPYKHTTPHRERVNQVFAWLDLPADKRPSVITLYFSDTDDAGHRFGPESPEIVAAIGNVDSAIGMLVDGLRERGIFDATNVIVVSDHGMAPTDSSRLIYWNTAVDPANVMTVEEGPLLTLNAPADSVAPMVARLNTVSPHMKAYAADDLPKRLQYHDNFRLPSIVCLADEEWLIVRQNPSRPPRPGGGTHGYDNDAPTMQATFIARGPAFKQGVVVRSLSALDVYPMMAKILGLKPAKNDGSLDEARAVLR